MIRFGRVGRGAALYTVTMMCMAATVRSAAAQAGRDRPARPAAAGQPPAAKQVLRTAADSAQARKDSIKALPLVRWEPADSVALALMQRQGYQLVRYKAENVRFGANNRTIQLSGIKGERAAVEREPTLLVSDRIVYNDSVNTLAARGDTIVMRDPSRGDDVTAYDSLRYDMKAREGVAYGVAASDKSGGQQWYIVAHAAAFSGDTSSRRGSAFYGRDGSITSCDDSIPHYHFSAHEIKRVSGSIMVARSVVLHIMDVPVMWFPFIFQDSREGRRTGMITPRFGITELFRNSPTYRRNVENLGYYFALSDYYDAQFSLGWRSSAKATDQDPGWVQLNGGLRYRWLNRFVQGNLAVSRMSLSSGSTNTTLTWGHQQDFSSRSKLTSNFNYSTNTTVQRQTVINPLAAVATIASSLNYQREMGTVSMSLGGTQRQYPGRAEVDRDFPSLNLTSKPISIANWLLWTPTFALSSSQGLHLDSQGDFANRYLTRSDGTLDSLKLDRNTRATQMTFNTPLKVFSSEINLAVRAQDRENDFPERRVIVDPVDTSLRSTRVYQRTYLSSVDFDLNFSIPQLIPGDFHVVPSVTVSNVDPNPYFVRSERTGSRWVHQSKRLSYGLGVSPTFFGFFRGVGSVEAFRHAITPTLSFSYSPAAKVSAEYLAALGQSLTGYVGAYAQNRVTLGISQYIEAKLRSSGDSSSGSVAPAKKVKVVSLTFTPLTWDFERARQTKKSGFATETFGYTLQSDLLPGFDFSSNYSLFQGSLQNDSAKFSPYLTNINATFNLDARSPVVQFVGRMFGVSMAARSVNDTASRKDAGEQRGSRLNEPSSFGSGTARSPIGLSSARGFDANVTFSKTQSRPAVGGTEIIDDGTSQCASLRTFRPAEYELCLIAFRTGRTQATTIPATTSGGPSFRQPAQTNIGGHTNFNLTEKWSAAWSTSYDVERREFASQTVSLQRDLHDWRAVFGFTQAPNGNFSFTFFVSLKAEPEIKFNYDRSSYRLQNSSFQP